MATVRKSRGATRLLRYPMKASTTITKGDLVMLDSDGLAVLAAASTDNKGCVGVATASVTSGASIVAFIEVAEGAFLLDGTTLAQASVGDFVFAEGATTVDETQEADEPVAGILLEIVSASSAWVDVTAANAKAGRRNPPVILSGDITLGAGDDGKRFVIDSNAADRIITVPATLRQGFGFGVYCNSTSKKVTVQFSGSERMRHIGNTTGAAGTAFFDGATMAGYSMWIEKVSTGFSNTYWATVYSNGNPTLT